MLFEKITDNEKQIIEILRHNYNDAGESDFFKGRFADTKDFLRFWEAAKVEAGLHEAFKDGLIIKKPVSITVEDDELHDKMCRVMNAIDFSDVKAAVLSHISDCNAEYPSIHFRGYSHKLSEIVDYYIFSSDAWVSNRYDGPDCEISLGENNTIKLVNGCKVMKALGRMVKACGGEEELARFEELRLRQSQILNEARINADLCVSIHPLDYMTASYNANDWRSCMCWEDGEFRRGVIEMMNSPMVVVAYIASKTVNLDWYKDLRWNSKRWREFFIVRPDMICGIKGYPYWNRALEDESIKMLRDIFAPVFHADYSSKIYHWNVVDDIVDEDRDISMHLEMNCGPAMYNDFYSDNEYHAVFTPGLYGNGAGYRDNSMYIHYSGASECVVCGDNDCYFEDGEGDIVCSHCIEHYSCCKCGSSIYRSDDLVELNGLVYCGYCYNTLDPCGCCGEPIDPDNDEVSMHFCVGWNEPSAERGEDTDVMRKLIADNYRPFVTCNVCGNCAEKVFKTGRAEVYEEHNDIRNGFSWQWNLVVPLSHLTEYGVSKLLDPNDVEAFIASHNDKALSA